MKSSYRQRWPLLAALAIGVASLIVFAKLAPEVEPQGARLPTFGGTYVEGVAGTPNRINPLFASLNEVDGDLASLVFAGLVRLGPRGDVQPDLAEGWTVSPDGLSYAFRLRSGLRWHDGEPLDSADVAFTVRTIQDEAFSGDRALAETFADVGIETPDPHTVILTLPSPFAPFLARGATAGILPEHLLDRLDADGLAASPFNQRPVGSGPFTLVSLTPSGALLRPFQDYHFGRPLLAEIEFRFYRDDPALLSALREAEVDGALFRPGLSLEDVASLDDDPKLVRRALHTTTSTLIHLNQAVSVLQDQRVRRALQLALDRDVLITNVLESQALKIDSPIALDLWASSPNVDAYAVDRDAAAALLDEAGWLLEDGRRTKDGEPLQFTLATSDDLLQSAVAREIARQWAELGIEVQVAASGVSEFIEEVLLARAFDVAIVSVDPGPDPDPYPFWHSSQAFGEGRNLGGYSSALADRLLENARQSTSSAQRASDYRAFEGIFAGDQPAVLLYTLTYQYITPAALHEVAPGLLFRPGSRFSDAHRWYLETATAGEGSR